MCWGNKIISSYRRKLFLEVEMFLYHLFYRPASPSFYRAVEFL